MFLFTIVLTARSTEKFIFAVLVTGTERKTIDSPYQVVALLCIVLYWPVDHSNTKLLLAIVLSAKSTGNSYRRYWPIGQSDKKLLFSVSSCIGLLANIKAILKLLFANILSARLTEKKSYFAILVTGTEHKTIYSPYLVVPLLGIVLYWLVGQSDSKISLAIILLSRKSLNIIHFVGSSICCIVVLSLSSEISWALNLMGNYHEGFTWKYGFAFISK